jgi:predicted ATP-dependent endonuclease of OLD family
MLSSLILINYRCFKNYKIDFNGQTIVVGKNNAGKSTIIEALRILSIVTSRFKNSNYINPPSSIDIPRSYKGFSPSMKGYDFNFDTVSHQYSEELAVIKAIFSTEEHIDIYIDTIGIVYAVVFDKKGNPIKSRSNITIQLPTLNILPHISPLQRMEKILSEDYVKNNIQTQLSSAHFRNQIYYLGDYYKKFKQISENTWPSLELNPIILQGSYPEGHLDLMVRNKDFIAEIGWMGNGIQMWLQTMWFLARSSDSDIVILDEPDVYLHPDLQRKLARILFQHQQQIIIATHSTEIIAESKPENILIIDHEIKQPRYAGDFKGVQNVINNLGGIINLQLTRLWQSKVCIFVEGNDLFILKRFQNILFKNTDTPFDIIPNISIGGWGGWNYAIHSSEFIQKAIGDSIQIICLLDSDYHIPEEISKRYQESTDHKINLHIWSYKEIENYLLNPIVIHRTILKELIKTYKKDYADQVTIKNVNDLIDSIVDKYHDDVFDNISDAYAQFNGKASKKEANKYARTILKDNWKEFPTKIKCVSGKSVLGDLFHSVQENYKISLNTGLLIDNFKIDEIEEEMVEIIKLIESSSRVKK